MRAFACGVWKCESTFKRCAGAGLRGPVPRPRRARPGGSRSAKSYIHGGRVSGGFALVAWPARYGDTGVMTFIVSRDAVVYEKDLGPQTASIARAIKAYEPDATWKKADIND